LRWKEKKIKGDRRIALVGALNGAICDAASRPGENQVLQSVEEAHVHSSDVEEKFARLIFVS
jgi:hypothetical protein